MVESFDAPSTSTYSMSGYVCARTLSIASAMVPALLKAAVTIDIFMESFALEFRFGLCELEVRVGHNFREAPEFCLRLPAEFPPGF